MTTEDREPGTWVPWPRREPETFFATIVDIKDDEERLRSYPSFPDLMLGETVRYGNLNDGGLVPRLRNLYRFAPIPDITFYFRAPLDVAVNRILSGRPKLKYYEAGMDLGLSYDRPESFRLFQARILEEYDRMVDSDNFVVLDGTIPVNKLQKQMRDIVASKIDLKRFAPHAPEVE